MADPTEVKIYHIVGPLSSADPTQFGVTLANDPVTGKPVWGGKDADGFETRWACLERPAKFSDLEGSTQITTPMINLADSTAPAPAARRVYWDQDEESLASYNRVDNVKTVYDRNLKIPVAINSTGSPILRGTPCRVRTAVGGKPALELASSTTHTFGDLVVFPMRDVSHTETVDALWVGMGEGMDTSGFSEDDALYLSTTPGVLTNIAPANPVYVGRCVVSSATVGRILYVGTGFGGDLSQYYNINTNNASDIQLETINGTGLNTVQDWMDVVQGTAILDPIPTITDNGDGTVNIGSGGRVIGKTLAADGSPTGFFAIPATNNLALIDNDINFIYVCYNGGSPEVRTSNTPLSDERDCIGIQIAFRSGTELHIASYGSDGFSLLNLLSNREADIALGQGSPATWAYGVIAGDTGARYVTLSEGKFYASLRPGAVRAFDTSGADDFEQYHGSTANGWTNSAQTQVNNSDYNDGTNLVTLSNNRFSTRWLYIDYNLDHLSMVVGPGNYVSQAEALDEEIPTDLPVYLQKFGILIGQYVVQQGIDTMVVRSPFTTQFSVGAVTSHASLSNILGPGVYHYQPSPALAGTGIEINQTVHVGGPDKFAIKNRDTESLKIFTPGGAVAGNSIAVTEKYIVVHGSTTDDYYRKFDKCTGALLQEYTGGSSWGGRNIMSEGDVLYRLDGNSIREIPASDITDVSNNITATGLVNNVGVPGNYYDVKNAVVYSIDRTGNQLQVCTRGATTYTVNSYTLAGVTGNIEGLKISKDGLDFYVVDVDGGNVYVRLFDIATRTLQDSSVAIAGAYTSFKTIGFVGDYIAVTIDQQVHYLSATTLDIAVSTSVVAITDDVGIWNNGLIYTANTTTIALYQPPALTTINPDFVDSRGGAGIKSANGVHDTAGVLIPVTKADEVRTVLDVLPLKQNQFGAVIESVETAEPGSPVSGKYYLIDSTSTWHPNTVAFYDARGWTIYQPYAGARVRDIGGQYEYEYYIDQWVKQVNVYLFGVTADSAGTGDSTTLTLDGTNPPLLSVYDSWRVRIDVTAETPDGIVSTVSGEHHGHWGFDTTLVRDDDAGSWLSSIDGIDSTSFPVNIPEEFAPISAFTQPTIDINSSTGAIEIDVAHTDNTLSGNDVIWKATLTGISGVSRGTFMPA